MYRRGVPGGDDRSLGYSAIWHGQKSWNGVALLSRVGDPVETRRGAAWRPEPGAEPVHRGRDLRRADRQHVAPNGNPKPGPKFDYKLAWLDALQAHAAGFARFRRAGRS